MRAVLEEADARGVPVRRVSQGSGVMMLTDVEIDEMARLGADRGIEVSLFLGPRGAWDTGGQSTLDVGRRWRRAGRRPASSSASPKYVAGSNTASARFSSPTSARSRRSAACGRRRAPTRPRAQDLCPAAVRERRHGAGARGARCDHDQRLHRSLGRRSRRASVRPAAPLSTSTSRCPDDQGGFVRFYDVPEMIRAAAPLYVKLGLRNAPNIYPAGLHLADLAVKLGRERVRRAELVAAAACRARAGARRGARRRPPRGSRDPDHLTARVLRSSRMRSAHGDAKRVRTPRVSPAGAVSPARDCGIV